MHNSIETIHILPIITIPTIILGIVSMEMVLEMVWAIRLMAMEMVSTQALAVIHRMAPVGDVRLIMVG